MFNDTDINKLIKEIEEFQKEEIYKLMSKYVCKNCGNISQELEIKKIESKIKEIKEFQKIVDEHNKNIKYTLFGTFKSDKKWKVVKWLHYIVIREEGETNSWINSYQFPFFNRVCYVTCPMCKVRNTFQIGVKD